jgi:hypothetical protein
LLSTPRPPNDITLERSERDRSAIYADFLPVLTSGRARLLDNARLHGQLCNLERKVSPMGRDRIDHPAGAHDDLCNAAACALVLAEARPPTLQTPVSGLRRPVEKPLRCGQLLEAPVRLPS